MTQPTAVKRAAMLGAGTIGASWTAWFLACGISVDVWDPRLVAEACVLRSGLRWAVRQPHARQTTGGGS
jgi:3-hydroxyacyl-CoA dehydrogenase